MTVIIIKPYTVCGLARLYGVSSKTMHRWIKPFRHIIGEPPGNYFLVSQVKIIFEKLDYP
jgi:hypothetical protein